jgi:thioredoxin 1
MATQFTDETAKAAIESGKTVVIDFWATWCGPCVKLGPVIEELAEKYEGKAIVGKLNVEENEDTTAEYGIRNIPAVLFFKDGKVVDKSVGFVGLADLEKKLLPLL